MVYISKPYPLFSFIEKFCFICKKYMIYNSVKLTQQFIDEDEESDGEVSDLMKLSKKRSLLKSQGQTRVKFPVQPGKSALVNKFIAKHRKL